MIGLGGRGGRNGDNEGVGDVLGRARRNEGGRSVGRLMAASVWVGVAIARGEWARVPVTKGVSERGDPMMAREQVNVRAGRRKIQVM